jgi:hypothetical protein
LAVTFFFGVAFLAEAFFFGAAFFAADFLGLALLFQSFPGTAVSRSRV